MQSFAANASDTFVSADAKGGEDSSNASEGSSDIGATGSSTDDNSQGKESTENQSGSDEEKDQENTTESGNKGDDTQPGENTNKNADGTTVNQGGNADSGNQDAEGNDTLSRKNTDKNADGTTVNQGGNADSGNQDAAKIFDAQKPENGVAVVAEEAKELQPLEIKATQFGTEAEELSSEKVEEWKDIIANVKTAMEAKKSAEFDKTQNVTVEKLTAIVSYILEDAYATKKDTFMGILPYVDYEADYGSITKATFNYIADNAKVSIQSAKWEDNELSLEYSIPSGKRTYYIQLIPKIGEKLQFSNSEIKEFEWNQDGKSSYAPEQPSDYLVMLIGKEGDKVVTYSNMVECGYTLPDVTDLSATSDRTGIALSWEKVEPATGYKVYRMTEDAEELNENSLVATIDDNTQITYKDDAVEADQTYIYKVVAYRNKTDEEGSDKWESQNPAVVTAVSPKWTSGKPAVTFMSPSSDQATLTWDAVSDAKGYEVYTYANGGCDYNSAKEVKDTKYQLTGLQAGQVYQYVVCPYKTVEGFRVYGASSDVVDVETKLGNSTIQAAVAAYNQIKVNWAQTAQADGYELYRNDQLYKTVNGISNCYLVDTVACGTTYNYKVRPFRNVNGKKVYGEFSTQVSAVTSLPAASMNKVTEVDYKTLDVSWNQGTGATGYELYRSTSSNSGFALVKDITNGNTLTYRDTGLNIGTTYYYKVKAYRTENGKKVYAPESGVISATVTLGTVTGLKATPTAYNRIELTWNKMSYATGYELYYSTSPNGNYKFLKKLGKNSVKFRWSKAQCGVTYYFQIRPIQKVKKVINYGSFSQAASAMTTIGVPTKVQVSKVTYDSITLKWKAPKGAKQYKIYVADSKDGTYKYLMTTKKKSLTFKNLATGKTYYYKVSAVRDSYESSLSGIVSGSPSIGKMSGLKVKSVSSTELQISWKKLKGAEKYVILRSTSANGTYTEVGTTNKTSYTDKNLANSTTYYYKVYAMRGSYKTDACGPANARTKDKGSINTNEDKKSIYKGIDVSQWQGTIDWDAVADDGIDFAMIRILRGKDFSDVHYDTQFKNNYKGARAAGLYVGVYSYSYATTRTQARKEAKAVVEALNGKKLDYPVVMDYEDSSILQGTSTNARRAEIILAYKKVIEDAGYKFALYANKNWLDNYIDTGMLGDTHIWIARWRSLSSGHGYNGSGKVTMWQYTDKGSVKGISGKVDMDVSYKKYQ